MPSPLLLLKLYRCYIIPNIEYCNVCIIPNITQNEKIESIQHKVTKYICYKMNKSNLDYKQRLSVLNLKTLECRRQLAVLKIVFKCIHNFNSVPENWKKMFIISENTRNGRVLLKPRNRINICDKNFFYYSINLFNSLSLDIRNETVFSKFIAKCEEFLL